MQITRHGWQRETEDVGLLPRLCPPTVRWWEALVGSTDGPAGGFQEGSAWPELAWDRAVTGRQSWFNVFFFALGLHLFLKLRKKYVLAVTVQSMQSPTNQKSGSFLSCPLEETDIKYSV